MIRHQIDEGTSCPLTMTFAAIPSLRLQPEIATEWEPPSLSCVYDSRSIPAWEKDGVLFGMGMTERQGGSDVQANTTLAEPVNGVGPGNEYFITGLDPLRTPGFRKAASWPLAVPSKAPGKPKEFAVQIHTRDHSQFGK